MNSDDSAQGYSYNSLFYQYQREGSARSANALLPAIIRALGPTSVLDVGCGAGAWLKAYEHLGVKDVIGVDGDYVDRKLLLIDPDHFRPTDISKPFDLGRTFDIAQCLEVAEHVPTSASSTLVDNITRHSRFVLFSAAVPGQGGEDHINEQPYAFWRDLFVARGFTLFDFIRPHVQNMPDVEPWYRSNVLFFAHREVIDRLLPEIAACRVGDNAPIRDYSGLGYRVRKAIMRNLPPGVVTRLAKWKHEFFVRTSMRDH